MSLTRWACHDDFAVVQAIPASYLEYDAPVEGDPIDLRDYPGRRIVVICAVADYNGLDVTFTVEDAEDDGGSPDVFEDAHTAGSLAELDDNGQRVVSVLTNRDRPYLRVVATGTEDVSAETAVVSATVLLFHEV